tara:strand:- start:5079 stop:5360 length:282 start_codon:yes stop_codon:yes gene_type:complete
MQNEKNNDTDWIDDFFDNLDDPKVDSCTLIGYLDTLILNSVFNETTKSELYKELDNLRESKVNDFIYKLKSNQNIRDPKEQYEQMVRRGVFTK